MAPDGGAPFSEIIYGISGKITPFRTGVDFRLGGNVNGVRSTAGPRASRCGAEIWLKRQGLVAERLQKTVVLVGMMGAGKTAVGGALSRMLGVPFLDSDDEIVRAASMSIAEIFARDGESFFRRKEAQVIARLLAGPPCVLSTGGGAYLAEATRAAIAAQGVAVWLQADPALLWQRVKAKATRPLLQTENPRARLEALCAERDPVYALADLRVTCAPTLSIDDMARRVQAALATRPDVLGP
jgi:shikimate kinase